MIFLNLLGTVGCLLLLAFAVYLPIHDRHPLDFLVSGVMAIAALTGMVLTLNLQHIVQEWWRINHWYMPITLVGFGVIVVHILGMIPERAYLGHERRRRESHR